MIAGDYHIHTRLCRHASGLMEEYVQAALNLGLKDIAFTDHIPLPDNFDSAHRMALNELEHYVASVEKLKKKYPQMTIRLGIEADFYDGFEGFLEKTIASYPFEVVILSVHFVKGWPANNWAFSYYFPDRTYQEIYSDYLQAVLRGIETGLFNVVGHLDLIKSPHEPLLKHNYPEVTAILDKVKQHNMSVELNTSGLRKEIGQMFPHTDFLPLLAEKGIPFNLGSDAHAPHQVGYNFGELLNMLEEQFGFSGSTDKQPADGLKFYCLHD